MDVRSEEEFQSAHLANAANVPLEEIDGRAHELPPRGVPLGVTDADPARAEAAAALLRARGHAANAVRFDRFAAIERGPARARLWRPNAFLVAALDHPALRDLHGRGGRALDVACGAGRDAVFLALAGFEVEAVDVLPDALARARDLARRSGVEGRVATTERDLEREGLPPGSEARYDLVTVFRFLWRPLLPAIRTAVRTGGFVVYETFHERTRESGQKPRSPEHLLRAGELPAAFPAPGFETLASRDGVLLEGDGRYVSSVLARRR